MADGGKRPPRVHAIAELLAALDDERLDPLRDTLADLDMFYIPTRYPDALPGTLPDGLPGREEAMSAIYAAREISRLVEEIMRCR